VAVHDVAAQRLQEAGGGFGALPASDAEGVQRMRLCVVHRNQRIRPGRAFASWFLRPLAAVKRDRLAVANLEWCRHQRTHALPASQLSFPVDLKSGAIAISS